MRLTLVAPHFPPTFVGGVELYVRRLGQWLASRRYEVDVVAVERFSPGARCVDAQVSREGDLEIVRLTVPEHRDPAVALRAAYRGVELEAWWQARLEAVRPDLIHLHSGYLQGGAVMAAAALYRVPLVVTLHDYWFVCPRITLLRPAGDRCTGPESPSKCAWCLATVQRRFRLPDAWSGGWLSRVVPRYLSAGGPMPRSLSALRDALADRRRSLIDQLNGADAVLGPSRFVLSKHAAFGMSLTRTQLHEQGTRSRQRRPPPDRAPGALVVGFLGQIAPHKGVHLLLEALKLLGSRAISIRVFGDLGREPGYVRVLQELAVGDPRIAFEGLVAPEQLDEVFGRLDVLAVPSVWDENSPFVIHEAQAAGVPVVASRLGGMTELIADGRNGLLVEPGDARDLARALARLSDEAGLLESLRACQPPAVRTVSEAFAALEELYARVAGCTGPAAAALG